MAENVQSAEVIARLLDITERRVRQLSVEGVIPKASRGRYEVVGAVRGYQVRAYEVTERDGAPPLWRAVDWEPMELSAVPVGADPGAGFRSNAEHLSQCRLIINTPKQETPDMEEQTLDEIRTVNDEEIAREEPEETEPVLVESDTDQRTVDLEAIADRAVTAERERIAGIYSAQAKLGLDRTVAEDLVARGLSLDEARGILIDHAATASEAAPTRSQVTMGGLDERETRRAAVESALLHRFDPNRYDLPDPAREWRG